MPGSFRPSHDYSLLPDPSMKKYTLPSAFWLGNRVIHFMLANNSHAVEVQTMPWSVLGNVRRWHKHRQQKGNAKKWLRCCCRGTCRCFLRFGQSRLPHQNLIAIPEALWQVWPSLQFHAISTTVSESEAWHCILVTEFCFVLSKSRSAPAPSLDFSPQQAT